MMLVMSAKIRALNVLAKDKTSEQTTAILSPSAADSSDKLEIGWKSQTLTTLHSMLL